MRDDAATYTPFRQYFELEVLQEGLSKWEAKDLERSLIEQHQARGPQGYNSAKGHPASARQFWYLSRRGLI